jgi:hypothetical protein
LRRNDLQILMPLVPGIEESHKVERVNECDFHGCCFGAP